VKPVLALLISALLLPAAAGEITMNFTTPTDGVEMVVFEGYDLPRLDGGLTTFDEGYPNLPGIPFTYLLPQGATLTGVTVEITGSTVVEGTWNIDPIRYYALNTHPGPRTWAPEVYNSNEVFPSTAVVSVQSGNKTGYRLGAFTLVPFMYQPLSGHLSMITDATVTLTYEDDPSVELLTLTDQQISIARQGLENIVSNPEMLDAWAPASTDGGTDWSSWVVIGDAAFETMLQPLVNHRSSTASSAEYVTLDWIYSNYTGYDTQEQIRNYLKDAYSNHGLVYALIIGDYGETTRVSKLYVGGVGTLNSTADLYYSDLDGTWDGDGDHQYGENTDYLDYYADIYVGRFSTDVSSRLQSMVDRTLNYEVSPTAGGWQTTALLPAAGLWPPQYWGSFVCDSIDKRIPPSWTVHKLYETTSSHPNNQIAILNTGIAFCEPTGHGFESGIYWYYNAPTDLISAGNYTSLSNIDRLPVMSSIACLAGRLSNIACIAERLMFWPSGGAVAVMFNSNNGFGTPPSMGPSEHLEVHIANQLWTYNQNEIGVMHGLAKDAFRAAGGMTLQNWVLQEHNLLGDPALMFVAGQTGIEEGEGLGPIQPHLAAPAPNPSAGSCVIGYNLPAGGAYTVTVYDLMGRSVGTIHDGILPAGNGSLAFDGRDNSGAALPSGCYSVVMTGTGTSSTTRLMITR